MRSGGPVAGTDACRLHEVSTTAARAAAVNRRALFLFRLDRRNLKHVLSVDIIAVRRLAAEAVEPRAAAYPRAGGDTVGHHAHARVLVGHYVVAEDHVAVAAPEGVGASLRMPDPKGTHVGAPHEQDVALIEQYGRAPAHRERQAADRTPAVALRVVAVGIAVVGDAVVGRLEAELLRQAEVDVAHGRVRIRAAEDVELAAE